MRLSSPMGHNGHEMPPKHGQICSYERALSTENWHSQTACAKIKSWPLQLLNFNTPWKEFRVALRNEALNLCSGKNGQYRPSYSQMFSGKDVFFFYESKFLHLLIPRDTVMSWTNVWTWFSWIAPPQLSLLLLIFGPCIFSPLVGWDGWMASPTRWTPGVGDRQGGLACCNSWGHKESDTTERLHFHFSLSCIGEGNGNPLQCSCLENPRDRGAW